MPRLRGAIRYLSAGGVFERLFDHVPVLALRAFLSFLALFLFCSALV